MWGYIDIWVDIWVLAHIGTGPVPDPSGFSFILWVVVWPLPHIVGGCMAFASYCGWLYGLCLILWVVVWPSSGSCSQKPKSSLEGAAPQGEPYPPGGLDDTVGPSGGGATVTMGRRQASEGHKPQMGRRQASDNIAQDSGYIYIYIYIPYDFALLSSGRPWPWSTPLIFL
jgi:hypothetical protein